MVGNTGLMRVALGIGLCALGLGTLLAAQGVADAAPERACGPCDGLREVNAGWRIAVVDGLETLQGDRDRDSVVSVYRVEGGQCCLTRTKRGTPGVYLWGIDPLLGRVFLVGHGDIHWYWTNNQLKQDPDDPKARGYNQNDFGAMAYRLTGSPGFYIHTTPPTELQAAANAPVQLTHSHGCIHVNPKERDDMIARGYLVGGRPSPARSTTRTCSPRRRARS